MARRPTHRHLPPPAPHPAAAPKPRSHAAAPVAVGVLLVGVLAGTYTILVPAVLGGFLMLTAFSFFGTRVNPLSIGFYLERKPSWSAIGIVFLSAVLLWVSAYAYYIHGIASILPR